MAELIDYHIATQTLIAADARFGTLIEQAGYPNFTPNGDYCGGLVEAVIGQQLNGKAANTIHKRFLALCNSEHPTPAQVAALTYDVLRQAGISRAKTHSILELAAYFVHSNPASVLSEWSDATIRKELIKIKGIGDWTVDMFLMFYLCRPDVLPVGDLGVRKGMKQFFGLPNLPSITEMHTLAAPWQPYRSLGSWYMWRVLEGRG